MKEYLSHVVEIESLVYEQSVAILKFHETIKKLKNHPYEKKRIIPSFDIDLFSLYFILSGMCGGIVGIIFAAIFITGWPVLIGCLLGVTAGIILYVKRLKRDIASAEKENKEIEERNQILYKRNCKKIEELTKALVTAQENLKRSCEIRKEIYSHNIIHDKYRNIIAVSSFYEYFDTGICNALEGVDGAYRNYEIEIRLDKIIGQLDVIIEKLEQIRSTQYKLYCVLHTCIRSLDNLSGNLEAIADSSQQIVDSLEIIEYNAEKNRKNTDELSWYERWKK